METTDIKFHEITIQDKAWMDAKFAEDDRNACEYTFANNFIWRKVYQVEVAECCDCLLIRFQEQGQYRYSYPIGNGEKKAAIMQLLFLCEKEQRQLVMSPLSEADRKQVMEWFPGRFLIEGDRDSYDYIYSREKLATLPGKKMHGKRNHIARFKDGDDWSYEPMTGENLEECRAMTYSWIRMRSEKWNEEMEEEVMVLHEAFDHMRELGLMGGILRKGGEIVAFTMGERQNSDTCVVHFEKAYPDMQGAYPMINQQFVQNACGEYTYVNREDDTGDPGLRKAKLSYYPEILLKKYVARESRVVYADRERDGAQIQEIWQTCFGDDEDYITFYLEHRMTEENMLVIYEDGKAVSMASFLPILYFCAGEYRAARYVYAVATLPEYRGRGLAREILQFAKEKYKEPLILAPAGKALTSYYEKLGFSRAFRRERRTIGAGGTQTVKAMELKQETESLVASMEPVTPEDYVKIRDARYEGEGYVRWDEDAVSYAMELAAARGGQTLAIAGRRAQTAGEEQAAGGDQTQAAGEEQAAGREQAAGGDQTSAIVAENESVRQEQSREEEKEILMYEKEGDTLEILETTLSRERLEQIVPELLAETGTREAVYDQMEGMMWLPESMRDMAVNQDGYLNLTLG